MGPPDRSRRTTSTFLLLSTFALIFLVLLPERTQSSPIRHPRSSSSCAPSCLDTALREELLVATVKAYVLEKLHLRAAPNVSNSNPLSRDIVLNALRRFETTEHDQGPIASSWQAEHETADIISFAQSGHTQTSISFNISKGRNTRVHSADLWFFPRATEGMPGLPSPVILRLWDVKDGKQLAELQVSLPDRPVWLSLPVAGAVQTLMDNDEESHLEVWIECEGCSAIGKTPILPEDAEKRAYLAMRTSPSTSGHRVRRSGINCYGSLTSCCVEEFFVKFSKIGFDWIIKPEGFYANYCRGNCPTHLTGMPGTTASFHTAVLNKYRVQGIEPISSKPFCCIPTKLKPMSIIFYDEQQNVIKKDIPDMVVEACGCA
uniref:inhibin beta A chain-like n=1 Tax=Myxine glutinosa TaxID=7769 RepID=UPI00358FA6C2